MAIQPAADPGYRASATRQLSCTAAAARAAVQRAVLVAGFRLESEQFTGIRAQRGSKLSGAGQKPDKLPMQLAARFADGDGAGCTVEVALQDRWSAAFGRSPSVAASYRSAFGAVMADLDGALGQLDPVAARAFAPMNCTVPEGLAGVAGPGRAGQLIERTNQALSSTPGSARRPAGPGGAVALVVPDAYAVLDATDVQAMTTAGAMIAMRPGGLPERLARQIARVVGALETATPQAGPLPGTVRIDLEASARPVLEFLRLQSRMRARLPLRTLQVCTTCRLEKVINPDFQRLQARNRKLRILSGTVGGAISPHGVSAFLLIGRLAQLKLLDPDFVCPRCQGMTAESTLITFCPRCGDRRTEAALRTCPPCGYDLRSEVPAERMWIDGTPEPEPIAWPVAESPPAVGPGRLAGGPPPVALSELPPPSPGTRIGPGLPVSRESVDLARAYPPSAWPRPPASAADAPPGGWHADPHGRHEYRWWDGTGWTAHVADRGVSAVES